MLLVSNYRFTLVCFNFADTDTLFVQDNNITGKWPTEFCPVDEHDVPFAEFGMDCDEIECTCCTHLNCFK
jgi:hypothetical protein